MHIVQCATVGADVATCPLSAIVALFDHRSTTAKILADHKKAAQSKKRDRCAWAENINSSRKVKEVVQLLNKGAVVVCPTDTVYAYVCSAQKRPRHRGYCPAKRHRRAQQTNLSLICKDLSQLSEYARSITTPASATMKKALPGALPSIVPPATDPESL